VGGRGNNAIKIKIRNGKRRKNLRIKTGPRTRKATANGSI
jgi:hypothetical protein